MIYMVVTETEEKRESQIARQVPVKIAIEKMTGDPCLIRWFTDVSLEEIRRLGVKAIFMMGFGTDIQAIPRSKYRAVERMALGTEVPLIGICGGHQLLGCIFGGDPYFNYPMRKLRRGEPDIAPYHYGMFKEHGFYEVRKVRDDPLFEGLASKFIVAQYHYCEVRRMPPDFVLLATNANCRVQAFRHRSRPIYGTQFHFERYNDDYPDGRRIMANFLKIAGYRKLRLK